MQLEAQAAAALETSSIAKPGEGITPNGQDGESTHLHDLLAGLQAMRMGDFSVRLPGDRYLWEDRRYVQRDRRFQ
jgi:hypothetical protein